MKESPKSGPYRGVANEERPLTRKANVLSALSALAAARGATGEAETLALRAAEQASRAQGRVADQTMMLRRAARAAFEAANWQLAHDLYCQALPPSRVEWSAEEFIEVGITLRALRRWPESEVLLRAAAQSSFRGLSTEVPLLVAHDWGVLLIHLGRLSEAEDVLTTTLARATNSDSRDTALLRSVACVEHALAECLMDIEEYVLAHRHITRAIDLRTNMLSGSPPLLGVTFASLARLQHCTGNRVAAESSISRALSLTDGEFVTIERATALLVFARIQMDNGQRLEVDRSIQTASRVFDALGEHPMACRALRAKQRWLELIGRPEEAAALSARVDAILRAWSR